MYDLMLSVHGYRDAAMMHRLRSISSKKYKYPSVRGLPGSIWNMATTLA